MNKSKVLVGIILLVYMAFIVFQFNDNHYLATVFDALLLPLITLVYFQSVIKKNLYFIIFLVSYAISDLMVLIVDYLPYNGYYYIGNGLYIVAYGTLLIKVLKSLSFFHIIKNFKLHIIVLLALNFYIAYVLQIIVNPYVSMTNEYFVEIIYNVVMLLLLSMSLLNYFYRDDRKSLLLFLGSLAIVFSEVIGVAYMYVAQQNLLNFLSTTLTLLAFYFYYQQSKFIHEETNMIVE